MYPFPRIFLSVKTRRELKSLLILLQDYALKERIDRRHTKNTLHTLSYIYARRAGEQKTVERVNISLSVHSVYGRVGERKKNVHSAYGRAGEQKTVERVNNFV